jgi:DivIVA domain-containing protein
MGKQQDTTSLAAPAPTMLTPLDVQQKEFRVSRMGGYKMRDVDEFLDQITDTLTSLTGEVERLRAGSVAPVVGSPDLDDVGRQADEIIARARAEAARITAEARAAGSAAPAAGGQDRQAVTAFIDRERAFLQSLAGLVQEHAETVKGMAKSARQAPPATARPAAGPTTSAATAESGSAVPPATAEAKSGTAATRSRAAAADDAAPAGPVPGSAAAVAPQPTPSTERTPSSEATADAPTRVPDSEATVRIEEPAPAGARSDGGRGDGDAEGDRSLRELFWGED